MDQRQVFDLVMQAQNTLPNLRENNRTMAAIAALRDLLAVEEEPFIYSAEFVTNQIPGPIPPLTFATFNINIQKDANFKILYGAYECDVAGAPQLTSTQQIPLATVLLTDTGSGRAFMDRPVPVISLFGNGQLPFPWPSPKIMKALSTLQVQVFNFDTVNTIDLRLNFIGNKEYALG